MITGGANMGRVGEVVARERHPGSFDVVHVKDATGLVMHEHTGAFLLLYSGQPPSLTLSSTLSHLSLALPVSPLRVQVCHPC